MKGQFSKEICIELLKKKQQEVKECGEDRYPKRADFSDEEVCAIKAFLGPWPRALEAAGLKPERDDGFADKKQMLRIERKRKITQMKKAKAAGNKKSAGYIAEGKKE